MKSLSRLPLIALLALLFGFGTTGLGQAEVHPYSAHSMAGHGRDGRYAVRARRW